VYGLTRDPHNISHLKAHEIIPVIGDAKNVEEFKQYLKACPVIVDCSNSMPDKPDAPEFQPLGILKATEEISKSRDPLLPPKIFVYTSGIMVYGNDPRVRDEAWPVGTHFYAQFRRKVEEAVTHSPHVSGTVIRPGWVFGGTGGGVADSFFFRNPSKLVLYGRSKDRRFSWIHIDDLAEAYVAAVIKPFASRGQIFNIVNGYDNPAFVDLAIKGSRLAGYKGEIYWEENRNYMDEAADATVILNSLQATALLGWTPKIFGFLDNLELYYESYKASKRLQAK